MSWNAKTFLLLKICWDRASKSGKFVKENLSMIPVFGMNTASCGKKLLRISEHFSES